MFGLIPRAPKKLPVPMQAEDADKRSGLSEQASSEELRLAKALGTILAKKSSPDTPTPPAKQTVNVGLMDQNGPGFFWSTSGADEDDTQSTSKTSKRWLQRAQRESRWGRLRRGMQWFLLLCGGCAVIILTLWPNLIK